MLNEYKIRQMTGIAMFEKDSDRLIYPAGHQFKRDYVSSHMVRSFIMYTIAALIVLGLGILYMFEDLLELLDIDALIASGEKFVFFYVAGLAVYLFITWIVYSRRYKFSGKNLKMYQAKMKRLEKYYKDSDATTEDEGDI